MLRGVILAVLCFALLSGPAQAQVTADMAKRQIEEAYGVEVLKVHEDKLDGRPVWLLTVMNPAGDFNEAFMVSTLAVDRETGDLVSVFRHRESGYVLPGSPPRSDKVGIRPDAARTRTWK